MNRASSVSDIKGVLQQQIAGVERLAGRRRLEASRLQENKAAARQEMRRAQERQQRDFDQLVKKAVRGIRRIVRFAQQSGIQEVLAASMYLGELEDSVDSGQTLLRVFQPLAPLNPKDEEEGYLEGLLVDISLTDISLVLRWWNDTASNKDHGYTFCLEIPFALTHKEIRDLLLSKCSVIVNPEGDLRTLDETSLDVFSLRTFSVVPHQNIKDLSVLSMKPQKHTVNIHPDQIFRTFLIDCADSVKFDQYMVHAMTAWGKKCGWYFDYRTQIISTPARLQEIREWVACSSASYKFPLNTGVHMND